VSPRPFRHINISGKTDGDNWSASCGEPKQTAPHQRHFMRASIEAPRQMLCAPADDLPLA